MRRHQSQFMTLTVYYDFHLIDIWSHINGATFQFVGRINGTPVDAIGHTYLTQLLPSGTLPIMAVDRRLTYPSLAAGLLYVVSHLRFYSHSNQQLNKINLHPANMTVIDLEQFQFLLNDDHCAAASPISLLLLVHSAPDNWMARQAIRSSWGRYPPPHPVRTRSLFQASNSGRDSCPCFPAWQTEYSKPTNGHRERRCGGRGRDTGWLQGHLPSPRLQECHGKALGLKLLPSSRVCGEGRWRHVRLNKVNYAKLLADKFSMEYLSSTCKELLKPLCALVKWSVKKILHLI